jgi:hypothetical protein
MGRFGKTTEEITMYSIARFTADKDNLAKLEEIGRSMNGVRPGVYQGLRRAGDGFACDLASGGNWREHQRSATDFVKDFGLHIGQVHHLGGRTTVDMSLGTEDLAKPIESLHFGVEFLELLSKNTIALEVTIYTAIPFPSTDRDSER